MLRQFAKDHFTLNGVVNGNYKGNLYFYYNDRKGSCEVIDNKFHFEGKIPTISNGAFSTGKATAMNQDLYLENLNMDVNITIEKKQLIITILIL